MNVCFGTLKGMERPCRTGWIAVEFQKPDSRDMGKDLYGRIRWYQTRN